MFFYGNSKVSRKKLKEARNNKDLKQKEVATVLKMTQQQYSRFENGIFELNYSQIITLCNLYGISPDDLFIS